MKSITLGLADGTVKSQTVVQGWGERGTLVFALAGGVDRFSEARLKGVNFQEAHR